MMTTHKNGCSTTLKRIFVLLLSVSISCFVSAQEEDDDDILLMIAGAIAAVSNSGSGSNQSSNVLLIIGDDIGVDNVSAYAEHSQSAVTPTIDELANNGVLFRNAWAHPVCSPTRASLYTGRYAFRHGVGSAGALANLNSQEVTIAELLSDAGYQTGLFGKWHLGTTVLPTDQGFDYFSGGLGAGVADYFGWEKNVVTTPGGNAMAVNETTYATQVVAEESVEWINNTSQPWLAVLAFNAPHGPFHVPPDGRYTSVNLNGSVGDSCGGAGQDSNENCYRAMAEAMDSYINDVLNQINSSELANTLIIFIGDNGTPAGATISEGTFRGNHAKSTPYEGGVNVPLIISGGSQINTLTYENGNLVQAQDVFSTILDLAGVNPPNNVTIDGQSLLGSVLSNASEPTPRTTVFTELFGRNEDIWTVRNSTTKYIFNNGSEECYNLITDPGENNASSGSQTTCNSLINSRPN